MNLRGKSAVDRRTVAMSGLLGAFHYLVQYTDSQWVQAKAAPVILRCSPRDALLASFGENLIDYDSVTDANLRGDAKFFQIRLLPAQINSELGIRFE